MFKTSILISFKNKSTEMKMSERKKKNYLCGVVPGHAGKNAAC
jgi:hypothetical protein